MCFFPHTTARALPAASRATKRRRRIWKSRNLAPAHLRTVLLPHYRAGVAQSHFRVGGQTRRCILVHFRVHITFNMFFFIFPDTFDQVRLIPLKSWTHLLRPSTKILVITKEELVIIESTLVCCVNGYTACCILFDDAPRC
jgi:hypothetical protein